MISLVNKPSVLASYVKELFYILTWANVIFVALESLKPGMVSAYVTINWVLILWFLCGILLLLISKRND